MMQTFKKWQPGITLTESKNIGIFGYDLIMVARYRTVEIGKCSDCRVALLPSVCATH